MHLAKPKRVHLMTDAGDRRVLNPLLRAALNAANSARARQPDTPGEDAVALCLGGYISSVYAWDKDAASDFLLRNAEESIGPDSTFVPVGVVRASLKMHFKILAEAFSVVCNESKVPVLCVPGPPPYRDGTEIVQRMSAKRNVTGDKVPQPMHSAVRLKVWKLANEVLHEELSSLPLRFVSVPSECVDEEGFLRPQFYGDGFHANAAYGALMLAQVAIATRSTL
jgi:hypothetical protein